MRNAISTMLFATSVEEEKSMNRPSFFILCFILAHSTAHVSFHAVIFSIVWRHNICSTESFMGFPCAV
jgi:hypothetical protein